MQIGIDLDFHKFIGFTEKEMENEILKFKQNGLKNFDVFYTMFNEPKYMEFRHLLLKKLKEHDITISFHSETLKGLYTTFENKEVLEKSILIHAEFLKNLRNQMMINKIDYEMTTVYHSANYSNEEDRKKQMEYNIEFYSKLSEKAKNEGFHILAETLSLNHPVGNHLGNDWAEIKELCTNVNNENFGICWDMGHTHLNYLENKTSRVPSKEILERVKFTHIHDWNLGKHIHHIADNKKLTEGDERYLKLAADHLPLLDKTFQDEEIKSLRDAGYKGVFSIECGHGEYIRKHGKVEDDKIKSLQVLKEIIIEK